ncbi:MAG: pyridoxamine 5'-phosphate oxidase family protein [Pseudomonadota bacterium]|nr:pyridoxamine 5'-phosphate oxidase family protein [Pseudomonadota bacterium]
MYTAGNAAELKEKFWQAMADSAFVMLQLDNDPDTSSPMTAQLDKQANSAIWFFTTRQNRFAELGAATAAFSAKGHDLFARFHGNLVRETSRERLDKQWSNFVAAWYPGGKDDPNLLLLRMDLGDAMIWSGDRGLMTTAKMAMGMDVREDVKGEHVTTHL